MLSKACGTPEGFCCTQLAISNWNQNWSPGLPHHNKLRSPLFLKRIICYGHSASLLVPNLSWVINPINGEQPEASSEKKKKHRLFVNNGRGIVDTDHERHKRESISLNENIFSLAESPGINITHFQGAYEDRSLTGDPLPCPESAFLSAWPLGNGGDHVGKWGYGRRSALQNSL